MSTSYSSIMQRPREWRRRVSIPARVNHGAGWSTGHIVNLSSRGMQMHCACPLSIGSQVEIRQDCRVISATVVWRQGVRAGLSCTGEIVLDEWLTAATERSLGKCAALPVKAARCTVARNHERSREQGRKLEFITVAAIAALMGVMVSASVAEVLSRPLIAAATILGS